MTCVPRRFYGQVTYSDPKEAHVFAENDAVDPIENNMHVIYHEPMKRSFRYDQKTKTFQQIDIKECELSTRYLLCPDAIFQRNIDTDMHFISRSFPISSWSILVVKPLWHTLH